MSIVGRLATLRTSLCWVEIAEVALQPMHGCLRDIFMNEPLFSHGIVQIYGDYIIAGDEFIPINNITSLKATTVMKDIKTFKNTTKHYFIYFSSCYIVVSFLSHLLGFNVFSEKSFLAITIISTIYPFFALSERPALLSVFDCIEVDIQKNNGGFKRLYFTETHLADSFVHTLGGLLAQGHARNSQSGKSEGQQRQRQKHENFSGSIKNEKDALEIFGMSKPYTFAELKKRRMELLKKVHPDQGGSNMMARLVNEAYEILKTSAS